MIEVTINGIKQMVPECTCGKCIVRRLRKDFFTQLPYSKDLGSTYTKDYPWKTPVKTPAYYNRSMHTGFENSYKPSLPNGHLSEMKAKYRPFSVDPKRFKKEQTPVYSEPFIGGTTYDRFYPNWGAITSTKPEEVPYGSLVIPLRGNSNYRQNYIKYPDKYYQSREPLNFNPSTLKFYGDIKPDTTYRTTFKPIDLNQPSYFPKEKDENPYLKSNAFISADVPPDNYESTYKNHYVPYEDKMCKLRKYLNARGMKYLVI